MTLTGRHSSEGSWVTAIYYTFNSLQNRSSICYLKRSLHIYLQKWILAMPNAILYWLTSPKSITTRYHKFKWMLGVFSVNKPDPGPVMTISFYNFSSPVLIILPLLLCTNFAVPYPFCTHLPFVSMSKFKHIYWSVLIIIMLVCMFNEIENRFSWSYEYIYICIYMYSKNV